MQKELKILFTVHGAQCTNQKSDKQIFQSLYRPADSQSSQSESSQQEGSNR